MPDALCGVEAELQHLVLGTGLGPEGDGDLIDLLDDILVVVCNWCLRSLGTLLDHEYVEVVDALDVFSRGDTSNMQRIEEPATSLINHQLHEVKIERQSPPQEDLGVRVRVV